MADIFALTYGVELLCAEAPVIDKPTLLTNLQRYCPGVEPLDPDLQSSLLSFVHPAYPVQFADGSLAAQTFVAVSDKPARAERLDPALQQVWEFDAAQAVTSVCTSSVLVTDLMSAGLDYHDRLELFQRALRGVLDSVRCNAIYWRPSERIVDPRQWVERFDASDAARLFTSGAVNVRMFNITRPGVGRTDEIVMDTLGLGATGLPDLQCHFVGLQPGRVAVALYNTAWYIFSEGDVMADGDTVEGVAPGSKWQVRREKSLVDPARAVLDLNPGAEYAAGNRAG